MKTILDFLIENKKRSPISFHKPGHKGRSDIFEKAGYGDFYTYMLKEDITEIPGADALFNPHGLIKSSMEYYADLYGVKHTELLVNGSSAGVIAAILATVPRGGKLILGRNSHHSAFSALRLGDIQPVYMKSEYMKEFGLLGNVPASEIRAACQANPDAAAVLVTSPNYYGMMSELDRIAEIVHQYGMILIVDQASGSHLKFFDAINGTRNAAEDNGADIVINSMHKTLLGITGTGILNVCSDHVKLDVLADKLRMVQTTSPSYLMLGSLDVNEKILRRYGGDMVNTWMDDLRYVYSRLTAIRGVKVLTNEHLDPTRISISLADVGVSAEQLERELRQNGVCAEQVHGKYVLLMTGAGNTREDYIAVVNVVRNLVNHYGMGKQPQVRELDNPDFTLKCVDVPNESESIPLYEADGRALYNPLITYPPGSPIACPGEIMNLEVISYVAHALERGEHVVGVDEEGYVVVGK